MTWSLLGHAKDRGGKNKIIFFCFPIWSKQQYTLNVANNLVKTRLHQDKSLKVEFDGRSGSQDDIRF